MAKTKKRAKKKSFKSFINLVDFQNMQQSFFEGHIVLIIDKKYEIKCCGINTGVGNIYFSTGYVPEDLRQLFYGCCYEDSNDDFTDIYSTTFPNFYRVVESLIQLGRLCYFKC